MHPAGPKLSFRVDEFRTNTVWEAGGARCCLLVLGCWMTQTGGLRGMDMDDGGGVFVVGGGDTIPLRV
ncbi:hypothetical protein CGLO_03716 [Colletotrichum gloeosporioides Cg-14]|uniref:Uncharacterized protein n=1 Tax=Colletotrichum gloeosporioides (strain Cg-14) TaxID=1237896 RepID=T0KVX0_COLGC|nr:hypothetical protein CGLO_03716 [Colletotrichum gloeosporioides Cg-14]